MMKTIEEEIQQKQFSSPLHRAMVNLLFTAGWLQDRHSAFLKPFDISVQQFNILRILRGQHPKPASIMLLKERMLDKNSDASRLVDRLVKKGLVFRQDCPTDRRQTDITITDAGLALLATIDARNDGFSANQIPISLEQADTLNAILDQIRMAP